ncbi:hypothetical protein COCVIDRAFT_11878 [Bipolaris victoriae FI3]|uniref:Uncharacterized protein n=1 Tax=Bipolaris victoriae (strain FI3) TaxID=930091 RepID=W7F155_BIPV3|nr:hypothetical protein COCVIDRAFT_11878 [Bipolaris victoriae FI3]
MVSFKKIMDSSTKNDSNIKQNTPNTKWADEGDNATRKQANHETRERQITNSSLNYGNQEGFYFHNLETLTPAMEKRQGRSEKEKAWDSSMPRYYSVKNIYNSGPEGENQPAWATWKMHEQEHREYTLYRLTDQDVSSLYPVSPASDHPLRSHRHAVVFPVSLPGTAHKQHEENENENETMNTRTRRDSGVVHSYAGLPISIEKAINTNKPLPPVPRIKPASRPGPKAGLPSSPRPITCPQNIKTLSKKLKSKTDQSSPRWKGLHLTVPQVTLKSKISFPGLLTASKSGSIKNIAVECDGISSSANVVSLPIKHIDALLGPYPSETTSSAKPNVEKTLSLPLHVPATNAADMKAKGKPAAVRDHAPPIHWRDAFVESAFEASEFIKQSAREKLDGVMRVSRRRKSSDASFMCQGVGNEGLDTWS